MAYVYRSITLAEGESYVLPAGAELVGVNGSITDEAGCANVDNVETLSCYVAGIGAYSDSGDPTYGETESGGGEHPLVCKGIYQNGIYTPFSTGDLQGLGNGCFDVSSIGPKIIELIPGVIGYLGSSVGGTGAIDNCLTFVLIQTVPSLAENLYIWMAHSVSLTNGDPGGTDFIIPFKTWQYWVDAGFTGIPQCTIALP